MVIFQWALFTKIQKHMGKLNDKKIEVGQSPSSNSSVRTLRELQQVVKFALFQGRACGCRAAEAAEANEAEPGPTPMES